MMDQFMMGIGFEERMKQMAERMKKGEMVMPPRQEYTPFILGPRSALSAGILYEHMLKKVAPYAMKGAIWYQGEAEDASGMQDIYDEIMKTLILSWRKLWGKEFPFFQVELAPFGSRFRNGAKKYDLMRHMQRNAVKSLPDAYDCCIMDAGDEINIHVRKKKPVGERLALLALKHAYGFDILADSAEVKEAVRKEDRVEITFENAGDGMYTTDDLSPLFKVLADDLEVQPKIEVANDQVILTAPEFVKAGKIHVEFAELNYCVDTLYNSAGIPTF